MDSAYTSKISTFNTSTSHIERPKKFTFPFFYEPNALAIMAAESLQKYLLNTPHWHSYFGLDQDQFLQGKMFGVLVVEDSDGNLGYISAFSGKLDGKNHHEMFVPPVFDLLKKDGFFLKEEIFLNEYNAEILKLETAQAFHLSQEILKNNIQQSEQEIADYREIMRLSKQKRKQKRTHSKQNDSAETHQLVLEDLAKESVHLKYQLKVLTEKWDGIIKQCQQDVDVFKNEIKTLKTERKIRSAALQNKIFTHYAFLNSKGAFKDLKDIFSQFDIVPPAGAGECAAPKLLHYAYRNQLKPIALAEFWWGKSPKSAIRIHGNYYPACRGKCEPILGHMLEGLEVDDNPMLVNLGEHLAMSTLYEDDEIIVINKPAELLSVPGKTIKDSVYTRIQEAYPNATGPLIIHRLDMSTSGILVLAKTKEAHKHIQHQFIHKHIQKRYIALLDGEIKGDSGLIELPLRVDLNDRPRQLVCFEHGKPARTKWQVISRKDGKTRIKFFPITGRTHQLRMHAAHSLGLNTPIVGDDLYGVKTNRLHLHAEFIEFIHPKTKTMVSFQIDPEF